MKRLMLVALLTLTACSGGDPASDLADDTMSIAGAEAEAMKNIEAVALPAWAPPPPVSGSCSSEMCAVNQVQFRERDWPSAWRGAYQGQRNVAFCLSTGCEGAVLLDRSAACAWRAVIIETNAADADETDADNLDSDCGKLTDSQRALSVKKADQIIATLRANAGRKREVLMP